MNKKKENFKRLAESRTNKVLGMIQLIGNLSNTSNYEYTKEEVDKIFDAILEEAKRQRTKFRFSGDDTKTFKL